MLSIFVLLFTFPSIVLSFLFPITSFEKLTLPPPLTGPRSVIFDLWGQGPYTGVSDGRILKYDGPKLGFQDYGFDTPTRSKAVCDGYTSPSLGDTCGRPLGLSSFNASNGFYVTDAYLGLLFETFNGRLARPLVNSSEGVPFRFTNGLDVYMPTGAVFFTDLTTQYNISDIFPGSPRNDSTGRLFMYDPVTANATVLLRGLSGALGVAVSIDGKYLLVTEINAQRILKYWLQGPKANTSEILLTLPGRPANIKRTILGEFWLPVSIQSPATNNVIVPTAIKINGFGEILANVSLIEQYNNTPISEFQEHNGAYYAGSLYTDFIGVYSLLL